MTAEHVLNEPIGGLLRICRDLAAFTDGSDLRGLFSKKPA
jgi:hypothetical protein